MAVDTARDGTSGGGEGDETVPLQKSVPAGTPSGAHSASCTCGDCPHGAREGHRRARDDFRRRRDELAAGKGLPAALAHSAGASRQWVSDELTRAARTVAERARDEGAIRLASLWRHTVIAAWGAVGVLLVGQLLSALAVGWTSGRTASLIAAVIAAGAVSLAAYLHRARGGALAPLIGEDNRLSTSRTVAAAWVLLAVYDILVLAFELAGRSGQSERRELIAGLELSRGAGLLTVLALSCAIAVFVRRTVTVRVQHQRLQKVRAERPRAADLLTDDAGRGSFCDVQYVLVSGVAVVFACVRLARQPDQLPDLPWSLALLVVVSAATYLTGKYAEGGRPVVLSVVRAREIGDLHAPIRTGDDIEIRGAGFVPPGAGEPDRLSRMVVRVGAVHVPVPLIPAGDGFSNPADATLTVPVPVEVEPGRVEVQVVTAAGVETNRYPIDVAD
ncbi:hypothetical protein DB35_15800 [Streptomyces abyssalis]|uniref:Integral membrane protein n=1 Tax=Streptomyces abyssalis TaxID=933944 RepID=A0A1E7JFS8_9ACTN|nr:hypothetical protein [Streptomyces abyssalis]OEU85310.1 hypothetical protein AN215_22220 [Streptomyces abyssalis]OEU91521.1 hypothetical protein DB35_15800 [Streptomyces abyssalis]OEV05274.1 hypothetical protein AN219_36535 [Streptomyces nanshensis]